MRLAGTYRSVCGFPLGLGGTFYVEMGIDFRRYRSDCRTFGVQRHCGRGRRNRQVPVRPRTHHLPCVSGAGRLCGKEDQLMGAGGSRKERYKLGRASCRERVGKSVEISVEAVSLKKKKK